MVILHSKTCLVVKPHLLTAARSFADTGIRIADGGARDLGAHDLGARDLGAAIGCEASLLHICKKKLRNGLKWSKVYL